eukprot:211546-Prymnesium_polylepis.2
MNGEVSMRVWPVTGVYKVMQSLGDFSETLCRASLGFNQVSVCCAACCPLGWWRFCHTHAWCSHDA